MDWSSIFPLVQAGDLAKHLSVPLFTDGASFRDFFKRTYGPTIAVYRSLADDPARTAELDAALEAHGDRYATPGPMEWEYLLLTARRTG